MVISPRYEVHWSSTLSSIDPDNLYRARGRIVRTVLDDSASEPRLSVTVLQDKSKEEGLVQFFKWDASMDELDIPAEERMDPIKQLYEDFGVSEPSGLLNRSVMGVYFFDRLVGFKKYDEAA